MLKEENDVQISGLRAPWKIPGGAKNLVCYAL
jgi:hypothetical protein